MVQCTLCIKFREITPRIVEILESIQPKISKTIPGIYTIGDEQNIESSKENPAVLVVRAIRMRDSERVKLMIGL